MSGAVESATSDRPIDVVILPPDSGDKDIENDEENINNNFIDNDYMPDG